MEQDNQDYQELVSKLTSERESAPAVEVSTIDNPQVSEEPQSPQAPEVKRYKFYKGEEVFELDEDAELELKADKEIIRLPIKELRERASGDVAIKKRMHQLAEEKKKITSTLADFSRVAKDDPIGSLKYIVEKAQEVDPDFDYETFLTALGDQAERMSKMSPQERENEELKKRLREKEETMSRSQRIEKVGELAESLIEEFDISEHQLEEYSQLVSGNEELMAGVQTDEDFFDLVRMVHLETENQRRAVDALTKIDPKISADDPLIFEISRLLSDSDLSSDFDDQDLIDIAQGLLKPAASSKNRSSPQEIISHKMRQGADRGASVSKNMSDFEILAHKLKSERGNESNVQW